MMQAVSMLYLCHLKLMRASRNTSISHAAPPPTLLTMFSLPYKQLCTGNLTPVALSSHRHGFRRWSIFTQGCNKVKLMDVVYALVIIVLNTRHPMYNNQAICFPNFILIIVLKQSILFVFDRRPFSIGLNQTSDNFTLFSVTDKFK